MTNHEPLLIHGLAPSSVTRVTRDMPHVEQALLSLQENPNSTLVLSGVHVPRSLVFCVVFCYFYICPFAFGHYIVFPSLIYDVWLSLLVTGARSTELPSLLTFVLHSYLKKNLHYFISFSFIWLVRVHIHTILHVSTLYIYNGIDLPLLSTPRVYFMSQAPLF